jgi:C4-dicarboxylate-specific signal transduction histidine kinase
MRVDRATALTDRAARVVDELRLFVRCYERSRDEQIVDLPRLREEIDRIENMLREALAEQETDIRAEYSANQ